VALPVLLVVAVVGLTEPQLVPVTENRTWSPATGALLLLSWTVIVEVDDVEDVMLDGFAVTVRPVAAAPGAAK
jgi:hypothetical protein